MRISTYSCKVKFYFSFSKSIFYLFRGWNSAPQMAAASVATKAFLTKRDGPIIVDEVQMVPDLFRPLKMVVDELRLAD